MARTEYVQRPPYDPRICSFKGEGSVSLLTLGGRILLPFVTGDHHRALLEGRRGQTDLVLRKGRWYLYVSVEGTVHAPVPVTDVLGVDLGVVNLATDSDGERYSGADVEAMRLRMQERRAKLQQVQSRSAHRKLQRIGRKEATFRKLTNHALSKRLVAKAQDTGRALALEDLRGIRDRTTVRRGQRARLGGWAFFQLRAFVAYKAQRAGVPVILVDPRNTSRTCPRCDHCAKANRRSQAEFICQSCGFAEHADVVGARNIARKGRVDRPLVWDVDVGSEDRHSKPHRVYGQNPAH